MAHLVLIRGIPGSGKSTLAKNDYADHLHFEADMFFMKDGEYKFDRSKIEEAHQWCQNKTLEALQQGYSVVVSNTFIRLWELQPYLDMDFPTKVVVAEGNYKSVHNVPDAVIERMKKNFEPYIG